MYACRVLLVNGFVYRNKRNDNTLYAYKIVLPIKKIKMHCLDSNAISTR